MTLISKVRGMSKTTTAISSNVQVVNFLNAGAKYVVQVTPDSMLGFLETTTTISTASGITVNTNKVSSVRRNGIECDPIDKRLAYAYQTTTVTVTSLTKGSAIFPKYFERGGKIFIKPDPTTAQSGAVDYIAAPTITISTSNTSLDNLENPMVLYAAALDSLAAYGYYNKKFSDAVYDVISSTDVSGYSDALEKAQYIIDSSTSLSQGEDMEYYLAQEDPEMISAGINMAQQEVNRALASLKNKEINSRSDSHQKSIQYLQSAQILFERADRELALYINGDTNDAIRNNGASGVERTREG